MHGLCRCGLLLPRGGGHASPSEGRGETKAQTTRSGTERLVLNAVMEARQVFATVSQLSCLGRGPAGPLPSEQVDGPALRLLGR